MKYDGYQISIERSIARILSTPLGTRVMLPEFGSRLHELIDRVVDDEWRLDLRRFVFEALERWEKRIKFINAQPALIDATAGKLAVTVIYSMADNQITSLKIGLNV